MICFFQPQRFIIIRIVGPVFGGLLYHHFGKVVPFLILAGMALIDGCKYNIHVLRVSCTHRFYLVLRLSIVSTELNSEVQKLIGNVAGDRSSSMLVLLQDPLILVTIGRNRTDVS